MPFRKIALDIEDDLELLIGGERVVLITLGSNVLPAISSVGIKRTALRYRGLEWDCQSSVGHSTEIEVKSAETVGIGRYWLNISRIIGCISIICSSAISS